MIAVGVHVQQARAARDERGADRRDRRPIAPLRDVRHGEQASSWSSRRCRRRLDMPAQGRVVYEELTGEPIDEACEIRVLIGLPALEQIGQALLAGRSQAILGGAAGDGQLVGGASI